MAKKAPSEALQAVGELCERLSGKEGPRWLEELKKLLNKKKVGEKKIANTTKEKSVPEDEEFIELPAVEHFSAKEYFRENDDEAEDVSLLSLGPKFKRDFVGGKTNKIEIGVPVARIKVHRLDRELKASELIEALGGVEKAEIALCHLWELLKRQGHGEEGHLLVKDFDSNIFFVRSTKGKLLVVDCRFDDRVGGWEGWELDTYDPNDYEVEEGSYVFSH